VGRSCRRFAALSLLVALAAPWPAAAGYRHLDGMAIEAHPARDLVLGLMNAQRERRGLRPLKLNRKLNAAAEDRLRDMFEHRYFGHVAPDGTQPAASVRRHGYDFTGMGENLATGQRGAREVIDQWMRSRGHRATLLGKFEDAGIAVAAGSPTGRKRGYTFVVLCARE
jgi:uncharacterized protein YkwD